MPKIKGIEVDKELAKAVFYDDILDQLEEELESELVSFKSLFVLFLMVLPAFVGILLAMWFQFQVAVLEYFQNYTIGDMIMLTVGFWMGMTLGPITSILIYLLVSHWAQQSFQGLVVIRIVGRNPSGSRTVTLDYIGEMPKPMRKPKIDELGSRFSSYLKEEVTKLHKGVPEEEIQAGLENMQSRLAEAYFRMQERIANAPRMSTVTRKLTVIKQDKEGGIVYDEITGNPKFEEVSVQVPTYSAEPERKWRLIWGLVLSSISALTLVSAHIVSQYMFGFDLFRFIFGWLPIWG